jgi:phosphoenolpyruvate-protein kinase (PTS system EI component)
LATCAGLEIVGEAVDGRQAIDILVENLRHDVGAPISYAAIVARELGIPEVVNCGDAAARLRTGDRVVVDGVRGEVVILQTGTGPDRSPVGKGI